jgi:hypothetical protein
LVRVFTRGSSRGIFISATEFTESALQTCKDALAKMVVLLCSVDEIVMLLERYGDFKVILRKKLQAAIVDKKPYIKVIE